MDKCGVNQDTRKTFSDLVKEIYLTIQVAKSVDFAIDKIK